MAIQTQKLDLTFSREEIARRGGEIIKDIARREIAQQKALKNGPHILTVDGRRRVTLDRAKRRIQADFAAAQLEQAISYVESAMARRVPRRSGRLRLSFRWLLNGQPVSAQGLREFAATDVLAYATDARYARVAYWRARRKFAKQYTAAVARGAKRQFRSLTVTDQWQDIGGGRQPAVTIRMLKVFARG